MASQNLQTNIVINAQTGSGFSKVGNTLTELGMIVDGISQQLIQFGKESVTVYRDYEKSMKDAEVALSTTYGRGTQELSAVMEQLDASATNWAASTIFHTNDVGNAIAEAAHAGWNYEQIISGLPAAMLLAQAGSIDLSEAVNYIVKATSAAGVGFDDMGTFIDLWTFAANNSATTIDEMGEAMLRMGSTMRFAGNTEELMTLIAVTANAGSVGQEAGTMIRNSILRLIAPTDNAREAMAQLGATSDETALLMDEERLAAANAALAAQGFSAFYQDGPQKGQMKNILDIYRELYAALVNIAGGYENIDRNGDVLAIMDAIFPTKTITEGMTLLRGAAENYGGLYDAMMGGDASGYGQYAAATMMDTLNGKIETFESKIERLKQLVGQELSNDVKNAADSLGGLVDVLSEMDRDYFGASVKGLEVLAAAGPGILLTGAAFRLLGLILSPTGAVGLGFATLAAGAVAMRELNEADFARNFGNMDLDARSIQAFIQGLGTDFREAYTHVNNFKDALNGSVNAYQEASSAFSAKLFQDMLTNTELTENDIKQLENLGQNMFLAVQGAIAGSAHASMSYWSALFEGDAAELDPTYQRVYELTNQAYEEAIAEAESIGEGLRTAMTSAFEDGKVSNEEYQKILTYMRSYNDAIARASAEAQSEEEYIKMGKWLWRAQTASLEDIKMIGEQAQADRDSILREQEDLYLTERMRLQYRGADAETLARTDALYAQQVMKTQAAYDEFLLTLWDSQIRQSEQADNYDILGQMALKYMSGAIDANTANDMLREMMGQSIYAGDTGWGAEKTDRAYLGRMMGYMTGSLGGSDGIAERIAYYESLGNDEMANRMRQMYAMEQLINNFGDGIVLDKPVWDILGWTADYTNTNVQDYGGLNSPKQANRENAEAILQTSAYVLDTARETIEYLDNGHNSIKGMMEVIEQNYRGNYETGIWNYHLQGANESEYKRMVDKIGSVYDIKKAWMDMGIDAANVYKEYFAIWGLLYGNLAEREQEYRLPVTPIIDQSAVDSMQPMVIPIQPKQNGEDSMAALQEQGVTVEVGADGTELQATIDGADGQTLMEYLNGDATDLELTIKGQDGKTLTENVTGNAAKLAAIINSYNGQTITVNIQGRKLFASGGRATSASIFGEAGPEWAIPEQHTERTAALLNAAREASGFTWPDIMARFGGLNANANHQPATIVYSPTIHANDASGVEQALKADKDRLEKWFDEKKLRDEVEVYT